jgi:hypothetical protein
VVLPPPAGPEKDKDAVGLLKVDSTATLPLRSSRAAWSELVDNPNFDLPHTVALTHSNSRGGE